MRFWRGALAVVVSVFFFTGGLAAGSRTAGAVFAFCRSGIEYGLTVNDRILWNIGFGGEYGSTIFYKNQMNPGVSRDFGYN